MNIPSDFIYSDGSALARKLRYFMDNLDKVHVVADFDRTLTQ